MARDIAKSSILKLCTYEDSVYPASLEIIDQLLPSEVVKIPIPKVSMVELTTSINFYPSHVSM